MKRELVETWNGLGNKPSLSPTVDLIDAACKQEPFSIINFIFSYFKLSYQCILVYFPCMEISLIFCLCFIYCVGAGITTLMSISDRSDPYFFCRKMEKTRSVKEEVDGDCLFPARVGISPMINNMIEVLFPICTLIWRVNKYVSRQGKV